MRLWIPTNPDYSGFPHDETGIEPDVGISGRDSIELWIPETANRVVLP